MDILNSVNLDPDTIYGLNREYAKARSAIEQALPNRQQMRTAKMAVIQLLKGNLVHPNNPKLRKFVQFPDGSKAVF